MKTNPFKLMTAVVMGAVLMMAFQCGKGEDPEPLNPNCNAHHSECLSHTDRDTKGIYSPDSASVVYDAASQRLHVTHHNLAVNCGTEGVSPPTPSIHRLQRGLAAGLLEHTFFTAVILLIIISSITTQGEPGGRWG